MGVDKSSSKPSGSSGQRRSKKAPPARVWAEAGVTIAVTEHPPQFVRFTFGVERTARGRSKSAIAREEADLFDYCSDVVNQRVQELGEIAIEAQKELMDRVEPYPYQ